MVIPSMCAGQILPESMNKVSIYEIIQSQKNLK